MEIEFDNVSYSYKKEKDSLVVLNDASFKLDNSNIYAFIGNSASGKTLIAEMISALRILIDGKDINSNKIKDINYYRSNIGYVYKNPCEMFLTSVVKDEISFGLKYYKYKLDIINKRIKDALILVGLEEEYLNKNIEDLSLSEKRKVALASVLVYNPKIIILDEPTIGINEKDKKDLIRIIRNLKMKFNKTVIILTKDTDFAYRACSYIYILDSGNIVAYGSEEEVLTDKKLLDKYGLYCPKCLEFIYLANKEKNANLDYYKEIGDLIKEVYRSVH